jgi:hypothetical protein
MKTPYREITSAERALLERLLSFPSNGGERVAARVENYSVRELDEEGSLKFAHSAGAGSAQLEQKKFPVEAQCQDTDGVWIHALLFLVGDKFDELEIYKDDSSPIARMPKPGDWETFELPFS